MVDLGEQHGEKAAEDIIKEKEANIRELKDDLAKENFMVAFLKQENIQLKVSLV